jgi:hypothetical protein
MGSFLCCCKIQNEPFHSTLQLDSSNSRNKGFSQSVTKSTFKHSKICHNIDNDQLIVIRNRSDYYLSKENLERKPFYKQFTFEELKQELADEWSEKIKIKSNNPKSIKENRIPSKRNNRFEGQPNYKNSSSLTFQNEDSLCSSRSVNSRGELQRKSDIKNEKIFRHKIYKTPENKFNLSEENDFSLRQYMQKNVLEKSNEVNFMNAIDLFKNSSLTKEQKVPTVESSQRYNRNKGNNFTEQKQSFRQVFDKVPANISIMDIKRFHTPEPFPLKFKSSNDIKPLIKMYSSYRMEKDCNFKSTHSLTKYQVTEKNEEMKAIEEKMLLDLLVIFQDNLLRNMRYFLDCLRKNVNNICTNERYEDYLFDSSKEEIKVSKTSFNKKTLTDFLQIYGSNKNEFLKTTDKDDLVENKVLNKSLNRNTFTNNTFHHFNGSKTFDYKHFLDYKFSDTLTISERERIFLQNSLMDFKIEKENVFEHKRSLKIARIAKELEDHILSMI